MVVPSPLPVPGVPAASLQLSIPRSSFYAFDDDSSIGTFGINDNSDVDDDDDRKLPAIVNNNNNNVPNVVDLTGCTTHDSNTGQQEQEDDKNEAKKLSTGKTKITIKSKKKQRLEEGINMNTFFETDYILLEDDERKRRKQRQHHQQVSSLTYSQDYILAKKLYEEELALFEKEQEEQLGNTITSKAWKFVQQVLKIVCPQKQQKQPPPLSSELNNDIPAAQNTNIDIQPIAVDDMVWTAERIFLAQENFRKCNKPTTIDIGYHYTSSTNLDRIRTDGLMSKSERDVNNIHPNRYNGSAHGDGIYTANNPSAYLGYGDTGLLVARLCGNRGLSRRCYNSSNNVYNNYNNEEQDSTIANVNSSQEIIVLKKSCQCLPIIQFHSSLITPHQTQATGNEQVRTIHEKLQKLIDDTFNNGIPTPIPPEIDNYYNNTNPSFNPHQTGFLNNGTPSCIPGATTRAATGAVASSSSTNTMPTSNSAKPQDRAAMERELKKQKENFLIFTRVLLKYLEQKDPPLFFKVKVIIKDCAERNRNKEPGYESVTASMKVELRKVVNDNYWKRAESYLDHFLKEKAKSGTQSAMQLAGSSASTAAPAAISAPTTLSSSSSAPTTAVASVQSSSNSAAAAAVAEAKRMQAELQRQQQAAATRAKQKLANQAKQQQRQQQQLMNSNPLSTTTSTGRGYIKRLSNDSIPPARMIDYEAPEQLAADTKNIYKSFTGNVPVDDECAICLNSLQKKSNESMDVIQLTSCGHIFHQHCIHDCLLHSVNCPTCRKQIMTPRGKMPSGTMTIKMTSTQYCSGEEKDSVGSYILTYNIPSGIQKAYHPNSGQYHGSAHRVAYVPNNKNGWDLLKRLEYAFKHGLTFMVGTSLTTHRPNSVVWSSIHHKTSPSGGIHGFPDPGYFDNCNNELDNLNVPKADAL